MKLYNGYDGDEIFPHSLQRINQFYHLFWVQSIKSQKLSVSLIIPFWLSLRAAGEAVGMVQSHRNHQVWFLICNGGRV